MTPSNQDADCGGARGQESGKGRKQEVVPFSGKNQYKKIQINGH